jgi:hypothetical protein
MRLAALTSQRSTVNGLQQIRGRVLPWTVDCGLWTAPEVRPC